MSYAVSIIRRMASDEAHITITVGQKPNAINSVKIRMFYEYSLSIKYSAGMRGHKSLSALLANILIFYYFLGNLFIFEHKFRDIYESESQIQYFAGK